MSPKRSGHRNFHDFHETSRNRVGKVHGPAARSGTQRQKSRAAGRAGSQKPSRRPPSMPLGTVEPTGASPKAPGDRPVTHGDRVWTAYGAKTLSRASAALSADRARATKRRSMHPR